MLNRLKVKLRLYFFKKFWRRMNRHNETTVSEFFDIKNVKVGKYTYGRLNIKSWNADNEGLKIGNYCSIADNVIFILGGNHNYNHIVTYPVKRKFLNAEREAYSNGPILIEDDVWIGYQSIILSGVNIGKGAVVAAGSVVTKNVPPYTIVGGNPARVIKTRFSDEIIKQLLSLNLSQVDSSVFTGDPNIINNIVDNTFIKRLKDMEKDG